ncbi:MAG: flagellar basal-body MS-ring/collar protein FliF [Thermodesulfobacteriota bacterium]|nr:flagellar basal-body MS-ring/collar protein FliF [Thermodesulfobacteriota bacterium]
MPSRELTTPARTLLKNLGPGKAVAVLALVSVLITGLVFVVIWAGRPDFRILYSNLFPEDAGLVLAKLKEQKIPYRVSSNGTSILIPRELVYETRLNLASQGLPRGSSVGFEIFDNTKLGMTEFVQNVNYQRALQGELSRTINGFAEVESSRVHIVMPSKSLFIEDEEPSTASVVVKLRPATWLTKDQIQGIVHLVSSSVSGLTPENVTIVDNYGKMLAGFEKSSTIWKVSGDQLEFQEKIEKDLENRINTMLESVVGPDKSITRVSCSLNFQRHEQTKEMYQPDNKVVRSEQFLNESSNSRDTIPAGVPGTLSNSQTRGMGTSVASEVNPEIQFQKQDRTVNYEIGKVTSHIVEPIGNINKLSVAVIVDGTYKDVKVGEGEEAEMARKYIPRSQEEMQKLEGIVKRAVNLDPERGDQIEVVNIPFETAGLKTAEDEGAVIEEGLLSSLKPYSQFMRYGIAAASLFLSFVFVIRPLIKWLTSSSAGDQEILRQLPKTVEEVEREYDKEKKNLAFSNRALQMIKTDEEQSLGLIRDWLKEEQPGVST